jgi:hypothetical protein
MPFDFRFFGQATDAQAKEKTLASHERFVKLLRTLPVIRCYVAGGPGYGHQSAGVNMIRRFAASPGDNPMGCGYAGKVEVYIESVGENDETRVKLLQLMPELDNKGRGQLGDAKIEILDLDDFPPTLPVPFGFCGACDFINEERNLGFFPAVYMKLKAQCVLMLQPYKWRVTSYAQFGLAPGNLVFLTTAIDVRCLNLDTGDSIRCATPQGIDYQVLKHLDSIPPLHIADRVIYAPIADLGLADWNQEIQRASDDIKPLLEAVQTLLLPENIAKYAIVPVYGVNYPEDSAFREPVSHRLALMMAGYQAALRNGANLPKRPIIINFSPYAPGSNVEMSLDNVRDLAFGGLTLLEQTALTRYRAVGVGDDENRFYMELLKRQGLRAKSFHYPDSDYFKVAACQPGFRLDECLTWLEGDSKRVLLLQGNRIPANVFNYVLKAAGLLPVFEGQNTAVPAIMTGKPYLHVARAGQDEDVNNYPRGTLNGASVEPIIAEIQSVADTVQFDLDHWPTDEDSEPTRRITNFINAISNPQTHIAEYFSSVRDYFSKLENDKIVIGCILAGMYANHNQIAATASPLDELYERINAELEGIGVVDILGKIFTDGGIHDYLAALLQLSGGRLAVLQGRLSAQRDAAGGIDQVTLTGNTGAFGLSTACELVFTMGLDGLSCAASFSAAGPWSLDGIPWIVFDQPALRLLMANGGAIPSGSIDVVLQGTDIALSLALPDASGRAVVSGTFDKPASISSFLAFVGGIDLNAYVPAPIQKLANIGVQSVQFVYNTQLGAIESIRLAIGSTQRWDLPFSLALENPSVNIVVMTPGDMAKRKVSASMAGDIVIGGAADAPRIAVAASVPGLRLSGQLASPNLPLNTLLGMFWPNAAPAWPGGKEPALTALSIEYDASDKGYQVDATLDLQWPVTVNGTTILSIEDISLSLLGSEGWNTGSLSGSVTILPDSEKIGLMLTTSYLGKDAGWRFQAQQASGTVPLGKLLERYLGWNTGQQLGIKDLSLQVETADSAYEFSGATAQAWEITPLNLQVTGNVKLGYGPTANAPRRSRAPMPPPLAPRLSLGDAPDKPGYYGSVSAEIQWDNSIDLLLSYNFDPKVQSFEITWGILTGKIEQKLVGGETHQVATLSFTESTSLGGMISTMVSWASGSGFSLSAPWNLLDNIPLRDFALEWDFTTRTVGLKVAIGPIDLGFATIKSIGLTYGPDPDDAQTRRVMVDLDASFIWGDKIPAWDATKPETTPSPGGSGNKYLELRMLAMGQHITFDKFSKAQTVQEAITLMSGMPEPSADAIPAVTFAPDSSWLFGADFGVLRIDDQKPSTVPDEDDASNYVVTLQTVFNDPVLYALRLALAGDAAKVFKGLDFQIMYRKLSDDLGVYKAELTLPDAMRNLTVGAYSITLPVFGVQVYTNGDFQIDIGFPWNQDFSRSFSVEAFVPPVPLLGSGGIYFGKIPQVAAAVPATTRGLFNPILVMGFGAQVGLGKSISYGVLKAGFSLTVFGILEGLLAKWNPYDGKSTGGGGALDLQGEYFFRIQGTFGLSGKIYGSVDFVVIKADVNVTVELYAQITFAAYQPIPITVLASVEAEASLRIDLWLVTITLHFSFSVRIKETFVLGALQNPSDAPWLGTSTGGAGRLSSPLAERLRSHGQALGLRRTQTVTPVWSRLAKPQGKEELDGYLAFALTAAGDAAFQPGAAPDLSRQLPCYVTGVFIRSIAPASANDHAGALKAAGDLPDTPFESLAKLVALWAVAAIQPHDLRPDQVRQLVVTEDDLAALLDSLQGTESQPIPLPVGAIEAFLSDQVELTLAMPAEGDKISVNAAFFPVPGALRLDCPASANTPALGYTFGEYNAVAPDFIGWLRSYFDQLAVQVQQEGGGEPRQAYLLSQDTSVAQFVFSDYFLLIMRQMLLALSDALRTFKQPIDANLTCNALLKWIDETGQLGGSFDLYDLFQGNADHALRSGGGRALTIAKAPYVIVAGDSLASIAAQSRFGAAFDGPALAQANADVAGLLASGATIHYPGKPSHTVHGDLTLNAVASEIFDVPLADLLTYSDLLGNHALLVPFARVTLPDFQYAIVPGDTLASVAAGQGITVQTLSFAANGDTAGLFDDSDDPYLDLVHLQQFQVGELIKEAQRSKALEHLSGMVSRYYLHGMRLPTDKITPLTQGMWVATGAGGELSLPPEAGLFALTGQQFPVPAVPEHDLVISVTRPATLDWLLFAGANPTVLSYTIKAGDTNDQNVQALRKFVTTQSLDTGLLSIGSRLAVDSSVARYALSSSLPCQCTQPLSYPVGGATAAAQLSYLPQAMCAQLPDGSVAVGLQPAFALQLHRYNEATGATDSNDVQHYGWASAVEFAIKRLPAAPAGTSASTTYEITGASAQAATLLERLTQAGLDNSTALLTVGYTVNPGGADCALRLALGAGVCIGLSQSNLSTDTRPPTSPSTAEATPGEQVRLLNTPAEFVTLLWEASITRAGGFYLYFSDDKAGGLPDTLFNASGEANLTLVIMFGQATSPRALNNCVNAALVGDVITADSGSLIAEAVPHSVAYLVTATDTPAGIAQACSSTLLSMVQDNSAIALSSNAVYTLAGATYMVPLDGKAPGGSLDAIAHYFAIDAQAIVQANPRIAAAAWAAGLPVHTAIRLPAVERTVGVHPGGATLSEAAAFYATSVGALLGANSGRAGWLQPGQTLTMMVGPYSLPAGGRQGVQALGATRAALPDHPAPGSTDYARDSLRNLYTMLAYRVVANQDFIDSHPGLPLAPQAPAGKTDWNKIRNVPVRDPGTPITYAKGLPYAALMSDGKGRLVTATNPYEAIGRLLQVQYSWNDVYGNRLVTELDDGSPVGGLDPLQPVLTGYTDTLVPLSQWNSIVANWTVAEGADPSTFTLRVTLSFDPSPYSPRPDDATSWKDRAKAALATYELLIAQLTDPAGVVLQLQTTLVAGNPCVAPDTVARLIDWLTEIKRFLAMRAGGDILVPWEGSSVFPLGVQAPRSAVNPAQIFALDMCLQICRNGLAQGNYAALPAVTQVKTPIQPMTGIGAGAGAGELGLAQFAKDLESTLSTPGEFVLTVGTGEDRFGGTASAWVVRLGDAPAQPINFAINEVDPATGQANPQIFAPRPVSNKLQSRPDVQLHTYASADDYDLATNALTGAPTTQSFTDVDLDSWVQQLFASVDLLLSPRYLSSILILDNLPDVHPKGVTSFVAAFNEQKTKLAQAAKLLASPVYKDQATSLITAANEVLYQQLLGTLSSLYTTKAVVSYSARVKAGSASGGPRLYGSLQLDDRGSKYSQVVLTSPKLPLDTGDAVPLTFAVEAPALLRDDSAGVLEALPLDISFAGSDFEHQIASEPIAGQYYASSWLRLVRKETASRLTVSLGHFELPMALREFPSTPRLDSQSAARYAPAAEGLSQMFAWNYNCAYSLQSHYAQDRVYGEIEYNLTNSGLDTQEQDTDAFQPLAQFALARVELESLLADTVPKVVADTSDPKMLQDAAKVLGAFLLMVSDIATASADGGFVIRQSRPQLLGEATLRYPFHVEENQYTLEVGPAWVVKIVSSDGAPPAGLADGQHPWVDVPVQDCVRNEIGDQDKVVGTDWAKGIYAYWYSVDGKPMVGDQLQTVSGRNIVMPGLNILQRQNAKASIYLKRNEELVAGKPSADAFVYQTPSVSFPNALLPSFASSGFDISSLAPAAAPMPLAQWLSIFFTALFQEHADGPQRIQMESRYTYSLTSDLDPVSLPVLLLPPRLIDPATDFTLPSAGCGEQGAVFVCDLAASLLLWFFEDQRSQGQARFVFDLTIMSDLPGHPVPLLRLTDVFIALSDVQLPTLR